MTEEDSEQNPDLNLRFQKTRVDLGLGTLTESFYRELMLYQDSDILRLSGGGTSDHFFPLPKQ